MRVVLVVIGLLCSAQVWAQAAYVKPVPTNVNALAKIYVDVSQPDCNCPNLQDANPDDPLYIWSWAPAEPVAGNGAWDSSNDLMVMTQDETNPKLWFKEVIITEFYGVDDATAYEKGLSFLVKKKDGLSGGSNETENKSNDFYVDLIAPPCEEKVCPHPQAFTDVDYFTLFYDVQKEINPNFHPDSLNVNGAQSLMEGDISIHVKVLTNKGNGFQNASQSAVWVLEGTAYHLLWDELQQIFYYTFIPRELFDLAEGENVEELQITFIKNSDPSGMLPTLWRTERETFYPACN
tara:strand:- start:123 stop:998 length:876 start_codon:yes stop_codon:yes gene_type:complete